VVRSRGVARRGEGGSGKKQMSDKERRRIDGVLYKTDSLRAKYVKN